MNAWMLRAPGWKLACVMTAVIAPFVVLAFALIGDRSWPAAVLMGLGTAVICGPVLGFLTANQLQDSMAAGGPLPDDDLAVVERAARRGPVPEDDATREAALRVAEDRLLVLRGTRTPARVAGGVLLLGAVLLAVTQSPWWWLAAAFWAALLVAGFAAPARLQRRAELLRGGR
ncbi:hypothetical protein [Blastococcus xanthinilyticus]|uniref:hypothetical protein n=1 Tax=Blastococcus xanthinilyticus TaxID=1564164 RepID=UPI00141354E9|nr:hypothetical protein [Blastococcus xanthinilyticus]